MKRNNKVDLNKPIWDARYGLFCNGLKGIMLVLAMILILCSIVIGFFVVKFCLEILIVLQTL